MEVGSIVQFIPNSFDGERGIHGWVHTACERGTRFTISSLEASFTKIDVIDDEIVKNLAEEQVGKHKNLSVRKKSLRLVQNKSELQRMHKERKISDKHYLDSLLTASND